MSVRYEGTLGMNIEKNSLSALNVKRSGVGGGVEIYHLRKYTPLYEKGIKETENKSMKTTKNN